MSKSYLGSVDKVNALMNNEVSKLPQKSNDICNLENRREKNINSLGIFLYIT